MGKLFKCEICGKELNKDCDYLRLCDECVQRVMGDREMRKVEFFKVIRTVRKHPDHFAFIEKLFYDESKACRWAKKWACGSVAILRIVTFPNGEMNVSIKQERDYYD